MESKIFLIILDNMDAGCQFVGYVRSEEQRRKCVRNSMLLRRGTFVLPIINISNWTAWNMNDEVLENAAIPEREAAQKIRGENRG